MKQFLLGAGLVVKGSEMPAWAKGGMDAETIWNLPAFNKVLPKLSAAEYQAGVATSEGHSHVGMEAQPAAKIRLKRITARVTLTTTISTATDHKNY